MKHINSISRACVLRLSLALLFANPFGITAQENSAAPDITVLNQTVQVGENVTFRVAVAPWFEAVRYEWRKDGVVIPGAISNTLTLANVQFADAGLYTVRAFTSEGDVRTGTPFLWVTAAPGRVPSDFNADGVSDLLFQTGDGVVAAWLMKGSTNSNSAEVFVPNHFGDPGYRIVATGDFNSDGREDILFQRSDGTLAVWLMNGLALIESRSLTPSNAGNPDWRVVATGRIDRDKYIDLLLQHTDGTLAVWHMQGLTLATAALLQPSHPGDSNWRATGLGDFDGDASPDLVFQHADGTLAVWFMNGTTLRQASFLSPRDPGAGWRVAAIMDANRDGKADLIFQHTNLDLAIWFMNGANLLSAQWLNPRNPGGTWRVVGPK